MRADFSLRLLRWYDGAKRDLPWRRTTDPYAVWISEIMLQQTRVAAVIPYYGRFLELFPTVQSLAEAPEVEVLKAWAGLGYYSRARNLQKAARQMGGGFPDSYSGIRDLTGIGDYTAAAVASIAFGLPYPAVDGNVLRVLSRVTNDPSDIGIASTRQRMTAVAYDLLDRERPGDFNQAMMELGATICLPRNPQCLLCPVAALCDARSAGRQNELPVKLRRAQSVKLDRTLLIVEKRGRILFWQREAGKVKLRGFWELPEPEHLPGAEIGAALGRFRHSIMNHDYRVEVRRAEVDRKPARMRWFTGEERSRVLLSTTARKSLQFLSSKLDSDRV